MNEQHKADAPTPSIADAASTVRKTSAQLAQTPPVSLDQMANNAPPGQGVQTKDEVAPPVPAPEVEIEKEYVPHIRSLEYYGGIPLVQAAAMGEELSKVRPGVPLFDEMGAVDIHALSMSIQSGMHGEVRYALDQLVSLSSDPRCLQLSLVDCGDLMDALIECAEEQLMTLAEGSAVISEETEIPNFEELSRAARTENDGLKDDPEFASPEYEMQQAVDRILAVTTILRNISFADSALNHDMLASGPLIPFIAATVKLIGTRETFFQNARSTLDFYKDCVTLLSNICHRVELPSKEDALAILQFLAAFAPAPPAVDTSNDRVIFALYDPKLHHYLASALDALAKLLARDEPNRAFYKSLFAADYSAYLLSNQTQSPTSLLLTRAFALAIAPIPDRSKGNLAGALALRVAEARKPFLSQGMLAADILASLCPGANDSVNAGGLPSLAQMWLESEDGWAKSLMSLVIQLASDAHAAPGVTQRRDPATGRIQVIEDVRSGFGIVVQRATAMFVKLADRCEALDSEKNRHNGRPVVSATMVNGDDKGVNGTDKANHDKSGGCERNGNDVEADFSVAIPFADVVPCAEEMLAMLSNPMFEPVTLRNLLALAKLVGNV